MMKKKSLLFTLIILFFMRANIYPWEIFDRVIAIVNDMPIIESDVMTKFTRLQKLKKIPKKKYSIEKSRLLDKFIENTLVRQTADDEFIIVSDKKVDNHINKVMESMRIDSIEKFKKQIIQKEKITFEEYREELRISLITEQVMSIAIGVSPPSTSEAVKWYNKNKKKLGYQVKLKHILIRPKNKSINEEKRVNKLIKNLRKKIISGQSFEKIAKKHSEDPASSIKGGDLGWMTLAELDPYFASQVAKMQRVGQLSEIIKSGFGYHIVKYFGKRPVSYDAVADKILGLLYNKKMIDQFKKWVFRRKRESEIKVYMEDYIRG